MDSDIIYNQLLKRKKFVEKQQSNKTYRIQSFIKIKGLEYNDIPYIKPYEQSVEELDLLNKLIEFYEQIFEDIY